jgi:predicted membrane channel-forming protein YqfA (hemolysin III family)
MDPVKPSWRKGAAIAAILGLILLAGLVALGLSRVVGNWPVLVQAVFYLALGLVWIAPLKPLLRWAETGSWRDHSGRSH